MGNIRMTLHAVHEAIDGSSDKGAMFMVLSPLPNAIAEDKGDGMSIRIMDSLDGGSVPSNMHVMGEFALTDSAGLK